MAEVPRDELNTGDVDNDGPTDRMEHAEGVRPADQPAVDEPTPTNGPSESTPRETDETSLSSSGPVEPRRRERTRSFYADDGMGDATEVEDEPVTGGSKTTASQAPPNWERELSAQRIAVELKRIETEVRKLLEDRDPKRKRRLAGSRRWRELEEDLIALRFTGRIDESTLASLRQLINRRHYLFRRLRFLALTRPTWNS